MWVPSLSRNETEAHESIQDTHHVVQLHLLGISRQTRNVEGVDRLARILIVGLRIVAHLLELSSRCLHFGLRIADTDWLAIEGAAISLGFRSNCVLGTVELDPSARELSRSGLEIHRDKTRLNAENCSDILLSGTHWETGCMQGIDRSGFMLLLHAISLGVRAIATICAVGVLTLVVVSLAGVALLLLPVSFLTIDCDCCFWASFCIRCWAKA
mmetsp:Transcript_14723/g.27952  ORF Transcript_14723/g.27952 Transcript_14723/m.27952 type:complete len:213 (-) Transcript_14723:232-870(-)